MMYTDSQMNHVSFADANLARKTGKPVLII